MKATTLSILSSLLLYATAHASTPVLLPIESQRIYSPEGFDSNDSTEIVLSGNLPNLCHKSPKTEVQVKGKKIEIKLKAYHYHESNPFCPKVEVPFLEVVQLGVLDKGNYKVIVNPEDSIKKIGDIKIAESNSDAVDEDIYANVEHVIQNDIDPTKITLIGNNPSPCFVLDRIEFLSNKKDTYSVLPILKQVSDYCPMQLTPFNYSATVPTNLQEKEVLLHVRVMNGKSVNSLFRFQ